MKSHAKTMFPKRAVDLNGIRSLTEFQRNARQAVRELKRSGRPQVLTVNGRAELVVQDAGSYQQLLDALDQAETTAAIHRGLKDAAAGKTMPIASALSRIRKKHGISR